MEVEMGDMKSAFEIAMEKVEKLGEATEEERLKWKYIPEGEKLATRYIKHGSNLVAELSQYEEKEKKYIIQGLADILIRNIDLPSSNIAKRKNKRVMDGLKVIKSGKVNVENVYSKMRRIFDHYVGQGEQQRSQAYESLKTDFEAKLKQQALQQQLGSFIGFTMDVERQSQFQEEWRRVLSQLDSQYLKHLSEYRQELSAID